MIKVLRLILMIKLNNNLTISFQNMLLMLLDAFALLTRTLKKEMEDQATKTRQKVKKSLTLNNPT